MIPRSILGKSFPADDLESTFGAVCTYVCTSIREDTDLTRIVSLWPRLSRKEKLAVQANVDLYAAGNRQ